MKVQIQLVKSTRTEENVGVTNLVLNAVSEFSFLNQLFPVLENSVGNMTRWQVGRGANHIWVSNFKGERLLVITETEKDKLVHDTVHWANLHLNRSVTLEAKAMVTKAVRAVGNASGL